MRSSPVLRQGALHALIHEGFWKSDHDFLKVFHCNFLSGMHAFRDNEVLLQAAYDVIVISPPGGLHAIFQDGFWKSDHDFLIAFHSNFYLKCMVSEITRFYCKPDMTSSGFLGQGRCTHFFDCRFWKGDPNFIIVLLCNYTSVVHRFRFNELFMFAGNDVIAISSLRGASGNF